MADRTPQSKQDEQYPLLKVAGGAGDGGAEPQSPTPQFTPRWSTAGMAKQSWYARWTECITSCWVSLILVGMSCLVFYGLCLGAFKRQPFIIVKCNNDTSKPASDVFYHHIVQKESYVPFKIYSEHLSRMAMQYPLLRFNVFFLVDDSSQSAIRPRHNRIFSKFFPYKYGIFSSKVDEETKRDINNFKRRYQNVNVTIMPLSRYMATTPLKYKWRMIPISYLPFYARIFTVWQNGGIGIDLTTFTNLDNNHQLATDRRVSAIIKQHNDGIKPEDYTKILKKVDLDQENAIFQIFYGLVHQILNETRSFFNKTLTCPVSIETNVPSNEPLIRTHRNKRDISDKITNKNLTNKGNKNFTSYGDLMRTDIRESFGNSMGNKYQNLAQSDIDMDNETNIELNKSSLKSDTNNSEIIFVLENLDNSTAFNNSKESVGNISEIPQVVLFYDFTIFSDAIGPAYLLNEALPQPESGQILRGSDFSKPTRIAKSLSHILSIDPEGMFVAAASRLHPFLGHIITSGCQRMPPKLAIQDALITQCSGLFKDDIYCNNIYLL